MSLATMTVTEAEVETCREGVEGCDPTILELACPEHLRQMREDGADHEPPWEH